MNKQTTGSTAATIALLSLKITAAGLGGATIGTATASEFDVEVEYTYLPRIPASGLSGAFEDADPGCAAELEIKAVKASANVHFEGDECEVTIKRGSEMQSFFTGRELDEFAERILDQIERAK